MEEGRAMQVQQMQAQQQAPCQQLGARAAQMKIQAETQERMQYRQADVAFEIEKMKNEAMLKSQLMDKEFELNLQLAQMNSQALSDRESSREDAKSNRISQQNTEQSKLINQRKNNLPPLNFESNEDSLDGFDFAEFNPR